MERDDVIEKWREAERELVIGWCGAPAAERPAAALRELVETLAASEGGECEVAHRVRDRVSQALLVTLCERYGLPAYRLKGQRRGTVTVQGPKTFQNQILAPMMRRGGAAVHAGVDAWLQVVLEACILDDVPGRESGGDDA